MKEKTQAAGSKKQKVTQEKGKRETKHTFSHRWLATTLKGHSFPVLSFDISPNGKYIAACAEGINMAS